MDRESGRLTVYYEEPFWVGVFERIRNERLSAAKVTFGAEPKDYEVWEYVLRHYYELQFSPAVPAVERKTVRNPKRVQRTVKKQLQNTGIGTRSQQALKLQQEQSRQERKAKSREKRKAKTEQLFEQKRQKRLAKHKGH